MTNATAVPVLWINNRPTRLLKSLVSAHGNTYFAPSKQAAQFGVRVAGDALPDGLATRFSVGTMENQGVSISTTPDDDDKSKVRGDAEIELFGRQMSARVTLHALKDGDFNLVVRVVNRAQTRTLKGDEIYVS